jgi:hypothetical protein
MVCHYDESSVTPAWQLLRRIGSRCGPSRPIKSVVAKMGQAVRVPGPRDPNELVFAKVRGIQVSGVERIRTLLYRARQRKVTINKNTFRFVPATAEDGLLLRIPARADWTGYYGFAKFGPVASGNAETIAFYEERGDKPQPASKELTIEFYAMPIRATLRRARSVARGAG